jgi:hypothetical protein
MFPRLTNIEPEIAKRIKNTTTNEYGKLNCFVRLISGTGNGLILISNPDWKLFEAAGTQGGFTMYGTPDRSGTVGVSWFGKAVNPNDDDVNDVPFKPSPIVTSINIKEGKDQISRHCDIKFTAFTMAQAEMLQKYFMEPGHSLCIEYGWNTNDGYSGLIDVSEPNSIPYLVGKRNLDYNSLHQTRITTGGEYDSFFGFIVGGTLTSNGDAFDVSIKLRGAPGLPTFLQSQFNVNETTDGTITNENEEPPFDITQLNLEAADQMAERRFKMMFNFLPKTRRTIQVKNLLFATKDDGFSNLDFINFDPVIENEISNFRDGRDTSALTGGDGTQPATSATGKDGEAPEAQGPAGGEGDNAAAVSGQQKKTQDSKGKARRTDPDGQKWERLNNIAQTYVKYRGNTADAGWVAYQKKYTITDAELSEAISTRTEKVTLGTPVGASFNGKAGVVTPGPIVTQLPAQNQGFIGVASAALSLVKLKAFPPEPPLPGNAPGQVGDVGGFTVALAEGAIGATEIKLEGGVMLPKEKLFSKNRYIRFGKAVQILNTNTALRSLLIAGKIPVNVVVDIKDTKIGAFKGIYSCKPESLLIPGWIPNFSKFFMESDLQKLSADEQLVNNTIEVGDIKIAFAQPKRLERDGYNEDEYRWGLLEHLYINFDLFKKELERPNQSMKDVLQTLLNEMSLAVNSFWNFQIAEKTAKIEGQDTTVYTIYDENWVGKYNSKQAPIDFIHSGERSKFLEANLNVEIPGAMMSKIISQRLSLVVNPDQQEVALGGAFSADKDRFFRKYLAPSPGEKGGDAGKNGKDGEPQKLGGDTPSAFAKKFNALNQSSLTPEQFKTAKDLDAKTADLNKQIEDAKKTVDGFKAKKIAQSNIIGRANGNTLGNFVGNAVADLLSFVPGPVGALGEAFDEYVGAAQKSVDERKEKAQKELALLETQEKPAKDNLETLKTALKDHQAACDTFLEEAGKQAATNVSNNLDIIDVVPNPIENSITQDDLTKFLTDINVFKQKFKVYCCRDSNFLNVLKVNNTQNSLQKIERKEDGSVKIGGSLTPPLPIKYSFKIIGRSGIRRGDTFNIIGIPGKYRNHGFFQVTEIEHTIQDMKWVTRIQGEYRQLQ